MIDLGRPISKVIDYLKNIVDSYENYTLLTRKRSSTDINGDDDSDDEGPITEPPPKRSKLFEDQQCASPILQSGSSNQSNLPLFRKLSMNTSSNIMNSALKDFGGVTKRSHLEVPDTINKLFNKKISVAKNEVGLQHLSDLTASNVVAPQKQSLIDPLFKFSPSVHSTLIRDTKSFGSIVKRRPISENSKSSEIKKSTFKGRVLHGLLEKKKLNSSFSNFFSKMNKYNTPMQSHRLDERNVYRQLLQQHTSCCVTTSSAADTRLALRTNNYYRKEEYVATWSGAIKKTTMNIKWAEKKCLMLGQEERNGTVFPKSATSVLEACTSPRLKGPFLPHIDRASHLSTCEDDDIFITKEILAKKVPSNSLEERLLKKSEFYNYDWLRNMKASSREKLNVREKDLDRACKDKDQWAEHRKAMSHTHLLDSVNKRIALLDIKYPVKVIEISDEEELPELTSEMENRIDYALRGGPGSATLAEKFNMKITRKDLHTLSGLNWLNDEVINFYLNLLMERSQEENKLPKIYAFNTFFYSKLIKTGFASVKRWTKKVDIFSHDLLIVPVHLGMHWCLATVDLRAKAVRYYDSMLGDNNTCLSELKRYLGDEHEDKRKAPLELSQFTLENVKEIPLQMNGSDCGMFSCKFADYICRDSQITFTQEHMPYFRRRMVYEIVTKTLL